MSQEMNVSEMALPVVPPKTSGLKGLIEVVTSPSSYFAKVKQSPTILVPYLAVAIIMIVFMSLTADFLVDMQIKSPQMQEQIERSGVTEDQMRGYMRPWMVGFGTAMMLTAPLLIALFAWFWGNFVFAGRCRWSQVLSVVLWGEYIFALGVLAVLPLVLVKGTILVSYSLAAFLPNPDPEGFLTVLLGKFSVFHIWELIVIGIGLSIIYELPRNKGMWLSVLSMGLLSIIHVAIAGIKSLF